MPQHRDDTLLLSVLIFSAPQRLEVTLAGSESSPSQVYRFITSRLLTSFDFNLQKAYLQFTIKLSYIAELNNHHERIPEYYPPTAIQRGCVVHAGALVALARHFSHLGNLAAFAG